MRSVKITRGTAVGGKGVEPGQLLTLSDADARTLVDYRKAVYVDADGSPLPAATDPGILTSEALRPFLDPDLAKEPEPDRHPDVDPEEEPEDEEFDEGEEERNEPEVETRDPAPQHNRPPKRRRR